MKVKNIFNVQALLWLALVLALVGSLRHVAWGFSTLEQGDLTAGYIQAVAVDIGLFALAIGIQQRRKQGRRSIGLWVGVVLFSGVSTYANLLHGLVYAAPVNLSGWDWLIAARPFVLSAVLPILVVYLSEIAAADVNYAVQQAERERRKALQKLSISSDLNTFPMPIEHAQMLAAEQAQRSKAEALDVIVSHLDTHPAASLSEIGQLVDRARSTVGNYLSELETAGRIRKNGNGWEVSR